MRHHAPVVGSQWEDRQDSRVVTVEEVDGAFAYVRRTDNPGPRRYPRTRVRLPLTRRYRHVSDPTDDKETDR